MAETTAEIQPDNRSEDVLVGQDTSAEPTQGKKASFKERAKKFAKPMESTTIHGVSHIFTTTSKFRRLFWLLVVLAAAACCVYHATESIVIQASGPLSTSITVTHSQALTFPAVTLCNLNPIRKSYLERIRLLQPITVALENELVSRDGFNVTRCANNMNRVLQLLHLDLPTEIPFLLEYTNIFQEGRQLLDFFVLDCKYKGLQCNNLPFNPWSLTFTDIGLCYVFNGGDAGTHPPLQMDGVGTSNSLDLVLNIQREEYTILSRGEVGVKLAIQPQGMPGVPADSGLAIPPGSKAFIALTEHRVVRSSTAICRKTTDTKSFNFLHSIYNYSIPACKIDCLLTNIARNCGCVETSLFNSSAYAPVLIFSPCGEDQFCCVYNEHHFHSGCGLRCPPSCSFTEYIPSLSYCDFPSYDFTTSLIQQLSNLYSGNGSANNYTGQLSSTAVNHTALLEFYKNVTIDETYVKNNVVAVSVYFSHLDYQSQVTGLAFGVIALISDIGGVTALFLGASVISVVEVIVWLFDSFVSCCHCDRISAKLRQLCRLRNKKSLQTDIELGKQSVTDD